MLEVMTAEIGSEYMRGIMMEAVEYKRLTATQLSHHMPWMKSVRSKTHNEDKKNERKKMRASM